jgi:mannose-6-phosphate isomerase
LYRTLVAPDGKSLDDRAFLYDQAFVLLALAESQRVLGPQPRLIEAATSLREKLYEHLKRTGPGFGSGIPEALPLLSNPHMHLLEATLSWKAVSDDPAWGKLADEIVSLALSRLIDARTGALREFFDAQWAPVSGVDGRIVEPGHQFEWAWLLIHWSQGSDKRALEAAARLVEIGESHGVHRGVAINALLDDFTVHDGNARLWPQTERLKAAVAMADLTGEARYGSQARQAAEGLQRYFNTEIPGLWHDRLKSDGQFVQEPSPASSFYHIVCAIGELATAVNETTTPKQAPRPKL